ncbi:hypothetical protein DFH09DRAFT_1151982 [Mycena vulgaris]|nr:hypothetical protein DFH09DRAFT_1151982 [Mycena vulgaris]
MNLKLLSTLFCLVDPGVTPAVHCNVHGCYSSIMLPNINANYSQMVDWTMTSVAGKITIDFTGTSLVLYFATLHNFTASIQVDGDIVATVEQHATQPVVGNILKGTVVDFDGLRYIDNLPQLSSGPSSIVSSSPPPGPPPPPASLPPTQPLSHSSSPSSPSSSWSSQSNAPAVSEKPSSTTSGTSAITLPTAGPTMPSPRTQSVLTARTLPAAAIAGIAAGVVSLLLALCLTAIVLRRRARRWKTPGVNQPFLVGDPQSRAQTPGAAPTATTNPAPSSLIEHLSKRERRFDAVVASRPSDSAEPSPPAYRDAA